MRRPPFWLLLSCEHAGNRVPARYQHLFCRRATILETHRAYDLGVYPVARKVARDLDCPLFAFFVTRLLIDANRSPGHRRLLSEFSRGLPALEKQRLMEAYYQPYRKSVTDAIEQHLARGLRVLHVSLHSFVPVLDQHTRKADAGVLYDTKRSSEVHLSKLLQKELVSATGLRVRRNYPYRGASDGFVTFLRRRYAENSYVGLELELNQRLFAEEQLAAIRSPSRGLVNVISESLLRLVHKGHQEACPRFESDESEGT